MSEVVVEKITPEVARDLLRETKTLCDLSSTWASVRQMAGAIEQGKWRIESSPIQINEHGVVLDGKKRLLAVMLANIPIQARVRRGADLGDQMRDIISVAVEKFAQSKLEQIMKEFMASDVATLDYLRNQKYGSDLRSLLFNPNKPKP